ADASNRLRAEAARQPEPIRTMLQSLVESSHRQVGDRVRLKTEEDKRQETEQRLQREAEDARLKQQQAADDARVKQQREVEDARRLAEKKADDDRLAREKTLQLRQQIDLELKTQVATYCTSAVSGRYPFERGSKDDVTAEDFARL